MAAETWTLSLQPTETDQFGNSIKLNPFLMSFSSQTRLYKKEVVVAAGGVVTDAWDPTTWAGETITAFQALLIAIQDVGLIPPALSAKPLEVELICNLANAQGLVVTIPPGGWWVVPGNASYRTPTAQNDQFTGSTAGKINRIRFRNTDAAVGVKASLYLVDNT